MKFVLFYSQVGFFIYGYIVYLFKNCHALSTGSG